MTIDVQGQSASTQKVAAANQENEGLTTTSAFPPLASSINRGGNTSPVMKSQGPEVGCHTRTLTLYK